MPDVQIIRRDVVSNCIRDRSSCMAGSVAEYDISIGNNHFTYRFKDTTLESIAIICYDIMEELRQINENGFTSADLEMLVESVAGERKRTTYLDVYNAFKTPRLEELVDELCQVKNGKKMRMINVVYEAFRFITDHFDDEEMYAFALHLLIRMNLY